MATGNRRSRHDPHETEVRKELARELEIAGDRGVGGALEGDASWMAEVLAALAGVWRAMGEDADGETQEEHVELLPQSDGRVLGRPVHRNAGEFRIVNGRVERPASAGRLKTLFGGKKADELAIVYFTQVYDDAQEVLYVHIRR